MTGKGEVVLRIFLAAALVAGVAAGCGSAAPPERTAVRGVPRALAHGWEGKASAIAAAAATGDDCHALELAVSLRNEVVGAEHKLPPRLRAPLVGGVNSLADRLTCTKTVTVETVPQKPQKPPKPPDKKPPDMPHGHGHGHGDGGGNEG